MSQENSEKKQKEISYEDQMKILLEEEMNKNSTPFWLSKAFVEKPFLVILACAVIFLVTSIITFTEELYKLSENSDRDYLLWDNRRVKDLDMFSLIQKEFQKSQINTQIPERSQSDKDWTTSIIIKCTSCSNILSPKYIKSLYEAEQKIKGLKDYSSFCLATVTSTQCSKDAFTSITQLFTNPASVTQAEIDQKMTELLNDQAQFDKYKGLMDKQFTVDNKKAKFIRAVFKFGKPLNYKGRLFKDNFDDEEKQKDYFKSISEDIINISRDKVNPPSGSTLLSFSEIIDDIEFQRVVNKDFLWAIGSIVFVLIYITFHLRSFFLSSMSMLSILFSFPITLVIFKSILSIDYFSSLHILVVFIVLGISADNVFVFTDAWNQSESVPQLKGDYNKRMASTFRRASRAMLATSSTTAAAFFANGISPIMPIASFGFFAGILIPVNFFLVITFYPAILIIYEKYTKNLCGCCQKGRKISKSQGGQIKNDQSNKDLENQQQQQQDQQQPQQQQQQPIQNTEQIEQEEFQKEQELRESSQTLEVKEEEEDKKEPESKEKQEGNLVERFFNNQFNTFVFKFRYPIILIFAVWMGISVWRTSKLPALSEPEQFLPDEFDTQEAKSLLRDKFYSAGNNDNGIKVYQYWGAKGIDKSGVGKWDSFKVGKVKFDTNFKLGPKENQQYLYDLCLRMKSNTELVQDGQVTCFMLNFKDYVEKQLKIAFPVEENDFFSKLVDFTKTPYGSPFYNTNQIGIFQNELKYVWIRFSAHGKPFAPYKFSNPVFEKWDDFVDETNKNAPAGLKGSKQTAILHWVFMITEQAFVTSAIQGMLISLAFAFVVLLLTTHNVIISFYSVLVIGGIVVSVIGVMEMIGWELGVAESITIVILIGLSVDYVVHLANHYIESLFPDRYRKMQMSLRDLGISIISGASTTIGSGTFLFFATIIVFNKFAILIYATILFSLAFALVFFSSLVHCVGPQGNQGNLLALCPKKKKQPKNKNNEKQQEKKIEGVQEKQVVEDDKIDINRVEEVEVEIVEMQNRPSEDKISKNDIDENVKNIPIENYNTHSKIGQN